jgi:hypothetical protein
MLLDDRDVPQIGLPEDVEDIAHRRNRTEPGVDGDVRCHPRELRGGKSEPHPFIKDPERDDCRRRVAGAGNEADETVEAKADARPRNADGGVEQRRDATQPLQTPRDLPGLYRTIRQDPSGWRQAVPTPSSVRPPTVIVCEYSRHTAPLLAWKAGCGVMVP